MKKLVSEIIIIVTVSILLALLFNMQSSKPLSLIKKQEKIEVVNEDLLFKKNVDTNKTLSTTSVITEPIKAKDTIQSIDKQLIKKTADSIKSAKKEPVKETEKIKSENLSKTVTYLQMLKIINNPDFVIVDARNEENFKKSHIVNSVNIFPYASEAEFVEKIFKLPLEKTIIVYCDGGECEASHKLAEIIIGFGYSRVFIYSGGWAEWSKNQGIN